MERNDFPLHSTYETVLVAKRVFFAPSKPTQVQTLDLRAENALHTLCFLTFRIPIIALPLTFFACVYSLYFHPIYLLYCKPLSKVKCLN